MSGGLPRLKPARTRPLGTDGRMTDRMQRVSSDRQDTASFRGKPSASTNFEHRRSGRRPCRHPGSESPRPSLRESPGARRCPCADPSVDERREKPGGSPRTARITASVSSCEFPPRRGTRFFGRRRGSLSTSGRTGCGNGITTLTLGSAEGAARKQGQDWPGCRTPARVG
jgi:hypothetical protein